MAFNLFPRLLGRLFSVLALASQSAAASQQSIYRGNGTPGSGDSAFVFTGKVNANETELYASVATLTAALASKLDVTGTNALINATIGSATIGALSGKAPVTLSRGTGSRTRNVTDKLLDTLDVRDYALCDGVTVETAAVQAAINAAQYRRLHIAGTCLVDDVLTTASANATKLWGDGGSSQLVQTNPAKGLLAFNAANGAGGLENITLRAAASDYRMSGSTGAALAITNGNENFSVSNVQISNFDGGISIQNSFSMLLANVTVKYARNFGVAILPSTSGDPSNDNRLHHFKVQNIDMRNADGSVFQPACIKADPADSCAAASLTGGQALGLLEFAGGGNFFGDWDVLYMGTGHVVVPPSFQTVAYSSYTDFLSDTSWWNNIVLDGSAGYVRNLHYTNGWASYATNGNGLVTRGANLSGVQWIGGRLRQNGRHGWDHQGGSDIRFVGASVANNSKITGTGTGIYHGVEIRAGVSGWSLIGNQIGNVSDGSAWAQKDNVHIEAGASDAFVISGNDLSRPGSGGQPLSIAASGADIKITGNRPALSGVDRTSTQTLSGSTSGTVAANSTVFLGSNGAQPVNGLSTYAVILPQGLVSKFVVSATGLPGGSQSYAYTLMKNNVATACTGSITASYTVSVACSVIVVSGDQLSIQLATSVSAAASYHAYAIEIDG